ncbi:MAG TPA: hypothetical protein VN888_20880 [Mycobacterium sp.]|nr:hypothetical protein [Mycobacterium sp.]
MAGKGWVNGMMRCGRYTYHEVVIHTTNPPHLVPSTPSPTTVAPVQIAARYPAGRPRR